MLHGSGVEVAHFHNTWPVISPAGYYAARAQGVAVVQTLHNYRLVCPAATLYRDGAVCEDCLGRAPWSGILHACYRGSRAATSVLASMVVAHRALGTWRRAVDVYVALTGFARDKLAEGGLPAERLVVKPNFVHPDPGAGPGDGGFALFAGRLTAEKGVDLLLAAWRRSRPALRLRIVGDGPLAPAVDEQIAALPDVERSGWLPRSEVLEMMRRAAFAIVPSGWYEGFPMTIAEAFACATPVLASNLGSLGTIVDDGRTGRLFRPGDAVDLAEKLSWLASRPEELARMRIEARGEYERHYDADAGYARLMEVYGLALGRAASAASR
jgi:glycosyltransferase involved in cell wall biosynthesis